MEIDSVNQSRSKLNNVLFLITDTIGWKQQQKQERPYIWKFVDLGCEDLQHGTTRQGINTVAWQRPKN